MRRTRVSNDPVRSKCNNVSHLEMYRQSSPTFSCRLNRLRILVVRTLMILVIVEFSINLRDFQLFQKASIAPAESISQLKVMGEEHRLGIERVNSQSDTQRFEKSITLPKRTIPQIQEVVDHDRSKDPFLVTRGNTSLRTTVPKPHKDYSSTVVSTAIPSSTTTPYITPTPSFLVYFAHSGFSNQLNALIRAAQLAYKLNRTLVLPPVLAHTVNDVKLFPNWKPDGVGKPCQAHKDFAIHQIKATKQAERAISRNATDTHSIWPKFPSFANVMDFSVLTDTTGLKTLDLDEFMQRNDKGRIGHAAAKGFSRTFFSSYNTSVHSWCNANVNLNVTEHVGERDCKFDLDLAYKYPTLLQHIQKQLDQQHGQMELWEGGYYRHDCRVLNVGSAFLLRNKFYSDPAARSFASFFNNYPLVEPWTSILKTLLSGVGGNFWGVHVRVLDGHKACTDSSSLYQQAAENVWALYNNKTTTSKNNNQHDDNNNNVLVIVGRVNGNSKLCLQQALLQEATAAAHGNSVDVPQVVTINDLIDSHENKKQLQQWITSIELEISTTYLLLDQFILALSENLVMENAYPTSSTFQALVSKRRAYRTQNLMKLGFLGT
jgi:hypothetical protein